MHKRISPENDTSNFARDPSTTSSTLLKKYRVKRPTAYKNKKNEKEEGFRWRAEQSPAAQTGDTKKKISSALSTLRQNS